jgi:GDP-D-mannose dehydratase
MSDHPILVTGAAGFIGFHVVGRLLKEGSRVVGIDNLNSYYDPALKEARLDILRKDPRFRFVKADLADRAATASLFAEHRLSVVLHLAAQAGVRYSLQNPDAYVDSISRLSPMSLKDAGTPSVLICCLLRPPPFTARTQSFRFRFTTTSTIRSAFMRPRRNQTN